ncbi:MAG: 2Fe-2S iron-sulfur cluster-binding protein [Bacteroidota bacterium]
MAKFYKLRVADVRRETADCVSVAFEVPETIKSEYQFIQGQYLTLKLFVNGEELRRSYSICTSPLENELRVAVKRVKDGKGSNFINDNLKTGDEMEVMTPMGGFHTPLSTFNRKNYVLFAGGSGITPMASIIKTVLQAEPNSTVQLFYGNLDEQSTIFREQLDRLASNNPSRFRLMYILDKPASALPELQRGIITEQKAGELIRAEVDLGKDNEFFICGPTPMMDNVRKVLESLHVDKKRIHIEYFSSVNAAGPGTAPVGERVVARVTILQYGTETSFELASDGKSILDAAIEHGVDAPFACKGAVCATCRGKVLEGKVRMEKNFALTDSEVADGFILTCQSHPASESVKVDYDA